MTRWILRIAIFLVFVSAVVIVVLPGIGAIDRLRLVLDQPGLAPLPVTVAENAARGDLLDDGKAWRVTRTAVRREVCESEVWSRLFRTADGVIQLRAEASSTGKALDPLTRGTGAARVGTGTAWWQYRVIPGLAGNYEVQLSATGCPSGYSGIRTIYVVAFKW